MVGLLGILLVGTIMMVFDQQRAMRLLRADNLSLHQQIQTVTDLPAVVSSTDWQRSVQDLTDTLVRSALHPPPPC